jgi:hypothetical protein
LQALAAISSLEIQMLYQDLLARRLSPRSIRYTHAVLRSALKQAMRWNHILANPADSVDLPRPGPATALILPLAVNGEGVGSNDQD